MACVLAVGVLGIAPAADARSAGKSYQKRESARNYVLKRKRRSRGPRIHLPIGPSYIYYDYPYYYSRGYYPTHIGGYAYYRPYDTRSTNRSPKSQLRKRARRN